MVVSLNQILMVMSTPAGKLSFFNSSTVLAVGSRMSISRLWVRCSKVSCDFLSECGERWTVKRSMRVGQRDRAGHAGAGALDGVRDFPGRLVYDPDSHRP
jgi:hypothetical protein